MALIYLYEQDYEVENLAQAIVLCSKVQIFDSSILAKFLLLYISINLKASANEFTGWQNLNEVEIHGVSGFLMGDSHEFVN